MDTLCDKCGVETATSADRKCDGCRAEYTQRADTLPLDGLTIPVSHSPGMMSETIRSPIKTHGGKFYLSRYILDICRQAMLSRKIWFEDCAGGANFTLQSEPVPGAKTRQVINEIDPLVWNVWQCYCEAELFAYLTARLRSVNVSNRTMMEAEWHKASSVVHRLRKSTDRASLHEWLAALLPAELSALACAVIVNRRMSRGGMGKAFAWQERERGGQPGEINSWLNFVNEHSPRVRARMANVLPLCGDSRTAVREFTKPLLGKPELFYYIDPPYWPDERTAPDVYEYEWTRPQHIEFITIASEVRGDRTPIAISGYENPAYTALLTRDKGWRMHRFSTANHSGQSKGKAKQKRIETLWTNF